MSVLVKSGTVLYCEFQTEASTPAGGASMEDLRALSQHNVSIDIATFKRLPVDSLVVSGGGNSLGSGSRQAL